MNRKTLLSLAGTLCLALMLAPLLGWASVVLFQNVKDLVAGADRVMVAEVLTPQLRSLLRDEAPPASRQP